MNPIIPNSLKRKNTQSKNIEVDEDERDALWALSLSTALNSRHIDIYQKCFEGYRKTLRLKPEKIHSIGLVKSHKTYEGKDALLKKLDKIKKLCQDKGIQTTTLLDKDYPQGLKEIFHPPPVLYYRGKLQKYYPDKRGCYLAIVGTRRSDNIAETITSNLAKEFTAMGGHIISGMAIGIDTYAHLGALAGLDSKKSGKAGTTAVLGCGVDIFYPWGNRKLYNRIIESGGTVISEYFPGSPPIAYNFPARNRIISGLSEGVLITQAPSRSGALITVDFALDQGRTVYAYDYKEDIEGEVPERNAGNYKLIREGAKGITSLADLFDYEFSILKKKLEQKEQFSTLEEKIKKNDPLVPIFQELKRGPKTLSQLSHILKLETRILSPLLLDGVISGRIKEIPGKKYFLG